MKAAAVCLLFASTWATGQEVSRPRPGAAVNRIDSLNELSASMEELSSRVSKAVVQIFSTGYALRSEGEPGTSAAVVTRQRATGSGVILSPDGYILTNGHVVSNARRVRVRLAGEKPNAGAPGTVAPGRAAAMQPTGKMLEAKIVGIDRDTDIAVLKIDGQKLPYLQLGDSDSLRQGQLVMAFGNPLGLENSVSMGVVSSVGRQIKPDDTMIYIQTDAPINPGNSGGPLVDAEGRVMGMNTFILSQSGGSEGLGFAIPSNILRNIYTQLRDNGHVHRTEIGVSAQSITPALATGLRLGQDWGVVLADVVPEGTADEAGLHPGDIVLSVNGKTMENARQLETNLYRYAMGDKVAIEVLRGNAKMTYSVAIAARDDDPQRFADMVDPTKNLVPKLGILGIDIDRKVAEMVPDLRKKYGVVVAALGGESPYSGDALKPGDVIHAVNTEPVSSVAALRTALDALKDTDPLVLEVERDSRLVFVTMEIE
jgi:serine protease Do